MIVEEFYHGWVIQVTQQPDGYIFQCWMSEKRTSVTDTQSYPTIDRAFRAGQLRADLESVRLSLRNFIRGKLKLLQLYPDEQNALENSVAQYIDTATHQLS
ncbi:hypothetical protein H6G20_21040 [Desertifilum sp. FACHB-1129]|uniref:Uncharacterized protein n=2 Tax=Cyanophyceae TaxID=3028117 RepID=A0A1E5QK91_9CYAN|nr:MULTISPECIES: hypothetical protein [Cyanophyceae]MDA0211105.1 hypothetical protein [Cyanobacteria bacterium FC1]MBD2314159.1 hypothetical protein [Desertifilum sp. FACHB-1129]MBD2320124.1 hypothetical protein [Desertifilum sp. FACHB-866]MBD2330252.1 hypothetical protein [Desertifilum sp. FACHB-868]MDL5057535.1 hypothetical protein [Geitlerinema calcuttense NRMC-F 0142]